MEAVLHVLFNVNGKNELTYRVNVYVSWVSNLMADLLIGTVAWGWFNTS